MFKPLSQSYSNSLTNHLHKAQGLISMAKGDFFPLFWDAWVSSFKENSILKAFETTGIWPPNADVILDRFRKTPDRSGSSSRRGSPSHWLQTERLLRSVARDHRSDEAKRLSLELHHLSVENELLHHENEGLREALTVKKRHQKKSKPLNLQQRQEYHGGAVFWSPRKVREARAREEVRARDEQDQKLQKARERLEREEKQLERQVELEAKRQERERLKVVREKERAEKAASRAAKIEAQNSKKAIQQSQTGKRKASRAASPKNKRQKRVVTAGGGAQVRDEPPPPPPKLTSRGRSVKLPSKFK
ncbi:hypothetical protein T440DRAFT_87008 [Plenodomus tracheiphilus IPT5]|uniref:Uncharacterized protein n=1 Tax=Plenodomus tracheiphilus IPT5 TaxID=1408161 RepID=A0A6A7AMJ9_9PLEO|nr:hypothetical protein T440DRAFT_87008 [Plenodomus tracheiphilus IPT5]